MITALPISLLPIIPLVILFVEPDERAEVFVSRFVSNHTLSNFPTSTVFSSLIDLLFSARISIRKIHHHYVLQTVFHPSSLKCMPVSVPPLRHPSLKLSIFLTSWKHHDFSYS